MAGFRPGNYTRKATDELVASRFKAASYVAYDGRDFTMK